MSAPRRIGGDTVRVIPRPELAEVDLKQARLTYKPARAAARDPLGVLLVNRCEKDRQLGTGTRQQAADLKAVVVAKAYV
jgi:hypothetical protein